MASRTPGRIDLSFRPKDNLELLQRILEKHAELGDASPLKLLLTVDLNKTKDNIGKALAAHQAAEYHKLQAELQYNQRDVMMVELKSTLRKMIALLKASYSGHSKALGEWGIDVNDTVRKPRAKKNQ